MRLRALVLASALAAALAAGCGGDDELVEGAGSGSPSGTVLSYALDGPLGHVDPLLAENHGEALLSRQIHEPLVDTLIGPFGEIAELPGLALTIEPSAGFTVWTVTIRPGVRFQNGEPLNADAILANVYERWLELPAARGATGELIAADSPRPEEVRFILDRPDRAFEERLAAPALGLVAPDAIDPATGLLRQGARGTGTGPFELRGREPASRALIAGNTEWWGAAGALRLGPGVDQISFVVEPSASARLGLLREGEVHVADELGSSEAAALASDPLLTAEEGAPAAWLGFERSVRGLPEAGTIDGLSGVWLAVLDPA